MCLIKVESFPKDPTCISLSLEGRYKIFFPIRNKPGETRSDLQIQPPQEANKIDEKHVSHHRRERAIGPNTRLPHMRRVSLPLLRRFVARLQQGARARVRDSERHAVRAGRQASVRERVELLLVHGPRRQRSQQAPCRCDARSWIENGPHCV